MYSRRTGLIIGFHGCDESIRNGVVNGSLPLTFEKNKYDWLGHGIYFWENNPDRALDFATEQSKRPKSKIKKPAVLGAVLDLGYCLDLLEKANLELVKKSYETLKEMADISGGAMPENKVSKTSTTADLLFRDLDCAVIQTLHLDQDIIRPFDSVKGVFTEGEDLYEGAGFKEKNHIQICIRDQNCIKGLFIPREKV